MSKDTSPRAKRMKEYELAFRQFIPAKSYAIIRVDGRAFHTLTQDMDKPFDEGFMNGMDWAAVALCEEIQNAQFAYVQSDEISVLVTDLRAKDQQWFGGEVPKWLSISAACATSGFRNWQQVSGFTGPAGLFDSRVMVLPNRDEVINYFLWRQADAARNAVQAVGQSVFTPQELHKVSVVGITNMLNMRGIYMDQYPVGARTGRVVTHNPAVREINYTHKRTGEEFSHTVIRHFWEASNAPWFDWDEAGFLESRVPFREEEIEAPQPVLD